MGIGTISIGRHEEADTSRGLPRVAATLQRLWVAYLTWRIERAAIMALQTMSDQDLNDIGLPRSEITAAVKGWRTASPRPAAGANPTTKNG